MTLEIRVHETVTTFDSSPFGLAQATSFVIERVKAWIASDDQTPLTITLAKQGNNSPPALGVAVGESIDTKEAFS